MCYLPTCLVVRDHVVETKPNTTIIIITYYGRQGGCRIRLNVLPKITADKPQQTWRLVNPGDVVTACSAVKISTRPVAIVVVVDTPRYVTILCSSRYVLL